MSFWLDGVSCEEHRIVVERYPTWPVPRRKYSSVSVPGRSGDLIFEQDAYDNVTASYDVYLSAERERLPRVAHDALTWLMRGGYRRLEDTYDPECFRLAHYAGGGEVENILNLFGRASISFNCQPQRWLKSGEHGITISGSVKLVNPTGMPARPIIRFVKNGNAESVITIGDYVLRTGANKAGQSITVDCLEQDVTANGVRINGITSGVFPVIDGSAMVTVTNALNVILTPRWWTL